MGEKCQGQWVKFDLRSNLTCMLKVNLKVSGMLQKTQDSWIRDKGRFTHVWHSGQHVWKFLWLTSPPPSLPNTMKVMQVDFCTCNRYAADPKKGLGVDELCGDRWQTPRKWRAKLQNVQREIEQVKDRDIFKMRGLEFLTTIWMSKQWSLTWKRVKLKSLSRVWLFATPWTVAYQDPQSMGFSRQEYWSGLPFPSAGDLPDPGIKPASPVL